MQLSIFLEEITLKNVLQRWLEDVKCRFLHDTFSRQSCVGKGQTSTHNFCKRWPIAQIGKVNEMNHFYLSCTYLVLSEIHSSLTSSFSLGSTLITSPPLVLTTMLLPTASNTSIDEVFLQSQ